MYQIYQLGDDLYQIHSQYPYEKSMEGTLLVILTYATYTLGFNINELELALLDMNDLDMNAVSFDYNKEFVMSFDRNERRTG